MNRLELYQAMQEHITFGRFEVGQDVLAKYITWWIEDKCTYEGNDIKRELPTIIGKAMGAFSYVFSLNYAVKLFQKEYKRQTRCERIPDLFTERDDRRRNIIIGDIKECIYKATTDMNLAEEVAAHFSQ